MHFLIPQAVCKGLPFTHAAVGMRYFHPEGDQLKEEKRTVSGSFTDFSCSVFVGCFHDKSNGIILSQGSPSLKSWRGRSEYRFDV